MRIDCVGRGEEIGRSQATLCTPTAVPELESGMHFGLFGNPF